MNWSNLWSKARHAAVVGVGAGAAVIVGALTGGAAVPFALAAKVAVASAVVYMAKPARPSSSKAGKKDKRGQIADDEDPR